MRIEAPCVVSLTWKLSDAQNRAIDELEQPVEFFFGGDDLLEKVEEALAGHVAGDELHLTVAAVDYARDGVRRVGAASHLLASLAGQPTGRVRAYIEPNPRFRLPRVAFRRKKKPATTSASV